MTATLAPAATSWNAPVKRGPTSRLRVTHSRVVLSEWTKFRSLRSTLYTLLLAIALMIGLGVLFTAIAADQPNGFNPGENAISTSLTGTFFAQLAIGVLGVLVISGEYSTGMIRASLTVVPSRLPMLWAKLSVFAAAVFGAMLITSFTAFFLGQALLSERRLDASLATPGRCVRSSAQRCTSPSRASPGWRWERCCATSPPRSPPSSECSS